MSIRWSRAVAVAAVLAVAAPLPGCDKKDDDTEDDVAEGEQVAMIVVGSGLSWSTLLIQFG